MGIRESETWKFDLRLDGIKPALPTFTHWTELNLRSQCSHNLKSPVHECSISNTRTCIIIGLARKKTTEVCESTRRSETESKSEDENRTSSVPADNSEEEDQFGRKTYPRSLIEFIKRTPKSRKHRKIYTHALQAVKLIIVRKVRTHQLAELASLLGEHRMQPS